MNRKLKAPPKLTKNESERLGKFVRMPGWHFDATIKKKCTEISSYNIYWDNDDKEDMHWVYADVYGLQAVRSTTNEPCIANFFIRYEDRVYQTSELEIVMEIIRTLKKKEVLNQHRKKLYELRWKEQQKLIALKQKAKIKKLHILAKEKAKVKKLNAAEKKKVA